MCWVGVFAGAGEEIAVDHGDMALLFVHDV